MKIGIICAGDREIAPFYRMMEDDTVSECAKLCVHEGEIGGKPVAVVCSGVCKVNAAIAAQVLIDHYGVTAIICGGTAGGMAENVRRMDIVVMTECAHHDVAQNILTEAHPYKENVWFRSEEELLRAAREALGGDASVHFGRMVTGESFITDEGRDRINAEFVPLSVDMETAAMAQVCEANGVPFIAVRCITDTARHAGAEEFERNVDVAAIKAAKAVVGMISAFGKC